MGSFGGCHPHMLRPSANGAGYGAMLGARRVQASQGNQRGGDHVFRWLRRRRLSDRAQRRLRIALARAEEELMETHVQNILDVSEAVAGELSLADVMEAYFEAVEENERRPEIVARRVLATLQR